MSFDQADEDDVLHDINVTPFIDVILVLLIVFMIAAPLATVDVAVDLPRANAAPLPRPDKPVYLTIRSDSTLLLDDASIAATDLTPALAVATSNDREQRIFVRADSAVPYGAMMNIMNILRSSGYSKIALVALEAPSVPGPVKP